MNLRTNMVLALFLLIAGSVACTMSTSSTVPAQPSGQNTGSNTDVPAVVQTNPAVSWKADGIITQGEYAGTVAYGDYSISWFADGTNIHIGLRAKTAGWVAVGIQPATTMRDADIIIGFVRNNRAEVTDSYSTGSFGPHPRDTDIGGTDDILESGGKEEGGYTVIEFKRALKTNDKYDKSVTAGMNKMIYSFGSDDDINSKHVMRGYGQINIQ